MCSARRFMVFNNCMKFHENMSSGYKVMEQTRKLLTHKGTPKVGKPELRLMCSARRVMVFNICVKTIIIIELKKYTRENLIIGHSRQH